MSTRDDKGWFAIREPLSQSKQQILVLLSFLGPILTWCIVSYTPFIWHPDIRLDISAQRQGVSTVFTAGDHLTKSYYQEFEQFIRDENVLILEQQSGNAEASKNLSKVRRDNIKILRQLTPIATKRGWLPKDEKIPDEDLIALWEAIATKLGGFEKLNALTDENITVIENNWNLLNRHYQETGSRKMVSVPLQKLVPQGVPVNPVYLPAPHEVLQKGWYEFTKKPENDKPSMWSRLRHSVRIVFTGFLLSCLVGVPLGILCGTYDFFSKLFEPFIDFFRYLPAPSFSTLLVAIFLAHDAPKIALVFVGTFFQLVLVVSKTTTLLDKSLLEAALTLGAKPKSLMTRVIVPGILPNLYNDLRILLGWSWTWLVIAELIGVKSGLTEFIETQGRWRNFDSVFPVIFTIGFIGFFTDQILAQLRGFFFPWTGEKVSFILQKWIDFYHWLTGGRVNVTNNQHLQGSQ